MKQPDYTSKDGTVRLYCGDCLSILPTLAPGSVDAVVTDPPYGVNYSSNMGGKFKGTHIAADGDTGVRDEMLRWDGYTRAIVFGSWKVKRPANIKQVLVWEKGDHVGMGDLSLPWRPNTEEIYIIGGGFKGHRGSAVLRINAPSPNFTPDHERFHPTEKPLDLMLALLDKCPGTILDPFMGSGTTGVACVRTGRKFIGIEIERRYFDIAVKRIERAFEDQALFRQPEPAHEQTELYQ